LARVLDKAKPNRQYITRLQDLLFQASTHISQVTTIDQHQTELNRQLLQELQQLSHWMQEQSGSLNSWNQCTAWAAQNCTLQGQELLHSLLLELYPHLVDGYDRDMLVTEAYQYDPTMAGAELVDLIWDNYDWVFKFDFNHADEQAIFWYYSRDKMEPRLGYKGVDDGEAQQMFLGIARAVQFCYQDLQSWLMSHPNLRVADFLLQYPHHKAIVERVVTMATTEYGDIRANLLQRDTQPIHLLRLKLAFFGVSKFDPQSSLWVRNTMFQGAPLVTDIGQAFNDDWYFPVAPLMSERDSS
jgi:hypothetical protein